MVHRLNFQRDHYPDSSDGALFLLLNYGEEAAKKPEMSKLALL